MEISGFVSGLSFPACVIDGSGKLALINPAMSRSHGERGEFSIPGSCSFTPSGELNGCANCSHYAVTNGNCVIPRVTPSSRLVLAAGLEKHGGSTVAFYTGNSEPDLMAAHVALGEILSLAGYGEKGKSRPAKVPTPARWEASVRLKDMVERAVEGLDFGESGFDLNVGGEVTMGFESLSAARLVISRMAAELLGLESVGPLMARSFSKPGKGATAHVISIQANLGRSAAKSLLNEISAMELRLAGYCQRLGRVMGLSVPTPHTLIGGGKADLRFELGGGFAIPEGHGRIPRAGRAFEGLSSREQQVLEMVVAGLANQEISKKLGIMASTVKQHIKNIYKRTGVRSRLELTLRAGG